MYVLLIAAVLQGNAAASQTPITLSTSPAPTIVSREDTEIRPAKAPQIDKFKTNTTPELDQNSESIHVQMAEKIGGQQDAISHLQDNVKDLEGKRENHDRPDIDDLIASRFHLRLEEGMLAGGISLMLALLWWAKDFLWNDTIKPRLKSHLVDPPKSTP